MCRYCTGLGSLVEVPLLIVGRGDPVPSRMATFIYWSAACEHQADAILHKEFHQQFELHSVVPIFQIDCHSQSLFLPLESFIDIICGSGCINPGGFPCSVSSFVMGKIRFFFLCPEQAFWTQSVPSASSAHPCLLVPCWFHKLDSALKSPHIMIVSQLCIPSPQGNPYYDCHATAFMRLDDCEHLRH